MLSVILNIPERFTTSMMGVVVCSYTGLGGIKDGAWADVQQMMIIFLGAVESPDACVQVADFFLRVINVFYVIVAGIVKDRMIVIFRGDGYRQDCGAIARKAFSQFGSAGGHRSAARVEIPVETINSALDGDLSPETVDRFLVQRLRRQKQPAT